MSDHKPKTTNGNRPPRAFGWMAEFSDEHKLLDAARKVRDSGYTDTDAFTPFPVHGIDEALGIKPTKLPFIVLCCGLTGLSLALLMQWWMNGVDYMYIISGKPFGITPASIPVAFEMTILFSAFSTFLGMIALNGLPRFSNPVFTSPRFDRATDDKFFLYVSAKDKYYNRESVRELLAGSSPDHLEEVMEDSSPAALPKAVWLGALLLVLTGLIPAMIVLNMRAGYSTKPRFHVFFDMDFQPKKKAQQTTTIFADGRSMRPQVGGTIARGQLDEADSFYLGYDPAKLAATEAAGSAAKLVSLQDGAKPADGTVPADGAVPPVPAAGATPPAAAAGAPNLNLPWLDKLPIEANDANMKLGQTKFQIYCAACHGYTGYGDGLVHKRADALAQGFWIPPSSMHIDRIRAQPVGQIFHTITKGQGKMPGYAASLTPKERWAIALYVKALQKSRNASIDDIPVDKRSELEPAAAPAIPAATTPAAPAK
ncbi:quinol:electron acceptor oxidoreductase subunit ActD [Pirellulaceae bacterium SH501]